MRRAAAALMLVLASAAGAGQQPSFEAALTLARSGRQAEAVAMFRDLAQAGDAAAQFNLAVLYARGQGTPQDDRRAAYWAWRARLAGETRAVRLSGYLWSRLTPALQDAVTADLSRDLTALAEAGQVWALLALGRVDAELRQPPAPQDALAWYTLAAAFAVPNAVALREAQAQELDRPGRLAAQERATAAFGRWCGLLAEDRRPATCLSLKGE